MLMLAMEAYGDEDELGKEAGGSQDGIMEIYSLLGFHAERLLLSANRGWSS